ncbi:MAG: hypothetical protein ACPLQO_10270, partial [Desulfotomaculales bacterium]
EPEKKKFRFWPRFTRPEQTSTAGKDWVELDNATILAASEISLVYYYASKEKELSGERRPDESEAAVEKPAATGRRVTLSGKVFS